MSMEALKWTEAGRETPETERGGVEVTNREEGQGSVKEAGEREEK